MCIDHALNAVQQTNNRLTFQGFVYAQDLAMRAADPCSNATWSCNVPFGHPAYTSMQDQPHKTSLPPPFEHSAAMLAQPPAWSSQNPSLLPYRGDWSTMSPCQTFDHTRVSSHPTLFVQLFDSATCVVDGKDDHMALSREVSRTLTFALCRGCQCLRSRCTTWWR